MQKNLIKRVFFPPHLQPFNLNLGQFCSNILLPCGPNVTTLLDKFCQQARVSHLLLHLRSHIFKNISQHNAFMLSVSTSCWATWWWRPGKWLKTRVWLKATGLWSMMDRMEANLSTTCTSMSWAAAAWNGLLANCLHLTICIHNMEANPLLLNINNSLSFGLKKRKISPVSIHK